MENFRINLKNRVNNWKKATKSFLKFLYDPNTREVIGRDGLSWTKISLFYFGFYIWLGSFFVAMLAVFASTLSDRTPRYFFDTSIMSSGKDEVNGWQRINPGLGFRPQINPESSLIYYSIKSNKQHTKLVKDSLDIFLHNNYNQFSDKNTSYGIDCSNMSLPDARKMLNNGYYCKYDYEKELMDTYCSPKNNYGYINNHLDDHEYGPCVAIKVNRIYSWLPEAYTNESRLPDAIKNDVFNKSLIEENFFIKCDGEYSSDRDAFSKMNVTYYSPNASKHKIYTIGIIPFYYYPYLNQFGYESPLVFLHLKNAPRNQLINILCKGYAANIDSDDKLNLRGMTEIQVFIDY